MTLPQDVWHESNIHPINQIYKNKYVSFVSLSMFIYVIMSQKYVYFVSLDDNGELNGQPNTERY